MDPNMMLDAIRNLYRNVLNGDAVYADMTVAARYLAEDIKILDEWLSEGGFLPGQWSR